jgi:hypothetical protein
MVSFQEHYIFFFVCVLMSLVCLSSSIQCDGMYYGGKHGYLKNDYEGEVHKFNFFL